MKNILSNLLKDSEKGKCEITCDCGRNFDSLEELVISLDDAGYKLFCKECPTNRYQMPSNQMTVPYV